MKTLDEEQKKRLIAELVKPTNEIEIHVFSSAIT
jgi:hypothetical protein